MSVACGNKAHRFGGERLAAHHPTAADARRCYQIGGIATIEDHEVAELGAFDPEDAYAAWELVKM